ncbi:MAG: type II/IV secretion system ATPase subunit [Candidatus Aenigmarchaeota archaeon]|nr:type II/IV secretion system ATPase subunit [Candidatus Aenigmarchaeota archaeon]
MPELCSLLGDCSAREECKKKTHAIKMLESLKKYKGILYKKFIAKKELELPELVFKRPEKIAELPITKDITKINITHPLIEPFAYAQIRWDAETKMLTYNVIEPELTEEEKKILDKVSDALIELIEVELTAIKDREKAIEYMEKNIAKINKEFGLRLSQLSYVKLMYYIYRNFIGLNEIEPLLQDPNIEDISCDGINTPVYVVHRKFGSLKTNIAYKRVEDLREFVIKLAERCSRYVSYAEPILAGTLPDGSRVSATLAGDVATRGPVFTIRKFTEKPISPVEQIELGTASAELLAYLWYLIEHKASILVVGGTATGKTSFLNTLCMFIQPEAKIVSIEDTREIKIPHEHWVPALARVGFGIPMPTGEKYGEVTLFDLLKESFRQNPDYVIVGETRGAEACVMFQGMSSGHPSLSTFHAGSVDTVIKRLTTPPIELSPTLIEALDSIVIMIHAKERGESARRIKEVVEIESVDPKTGEVKTNLVFRWNPASDSYEKVYDSIKLKKIVTERGGRLEDALAEVERRKRILELMRERGIRDFLEVTKFINQYYKEPKSVHEMLKTRVEARRLEIKEMRKKVIPFLQFLGFKFLREG